ncbi:MAG: hypothetical protein KBS95_08510 [Alistipes sp.]|nr:hypothetical protein [Candidatus Alistipes equi]
MIHFLFATEMESKVLDGVKEKFTLDICGWGIDECRRNIPSIIEKYGQGVYVLSGIAGAYPESGIKKGDVVEVITESYEGESSSINSSIQLTTLPKVESMTVKSCNRPHGKAKIENMEGAPFFEQCATYGFSFTEIRAVSNITNEPRENWDIDTALKKLKENLKNILDE